MLRRGSVSFAIAMIIIGSSYGVKADAHHSAAMFDRKSKLVLQGTVKEFQWTNPHGFIQLLVDSPAGPVEWSIEMQDPRAMFRNGWRPDSIKPGDQITVTINPAWDGNKTVSLVSATDREGHPIGKVISR